MARDADALKIEKWAAAGDVQDPEERGLDRSVGWPADYSQPGGRQPSREVFNQLLRELSALGVEVNVHGAFLEWDSSISYIHPAVVTGSDTKLYLSVGSSQGVDPTTDSSESHWKLLTASVANSSATQSGIVELATDAEVGVGTDATRAITPAGLASQGYRRVTVSNSAPTGSDGDDGDVWLEY